MNKRISVKTESGIKYYKVLQEYKQFCCKRFVDSNIVKWSDIGITKNIEDALVLINLDAENEFGLLINSILNK